VKLWAARTWAWTGSLIWSADGRKLILAAGEQVDGPLQVWLVSYPEATARRITNDLSNYSKLSLTADSNTLVAVRKETSAKLWITRSGDASRAVRITSNNVRGLNLVAWTPGGKIVLSALAGDYRNIWMMDADGRNLRQLTAGPYDKDEVAVTRNGRYIVYQTQGRIWRMNADGSEPRQLTHGALDVHPCSSADSRWIVYASFRDWAPGIGGDPSLWKVPIDGGAPTQISTASASMPQISPDGKRIACTWYGAADLFSASPKLAVLPFDGGAPIQVFEQLSGSTSQFSWTADGQALDFSREIDGVGNVWRHPLGGGAPAPVTKFETDQLLRIARSYDGRQFALARGKVVTDVVRITGFL
jgi:Tol biopolymer transport system component